MSLKNVSIFIISYLMVLCGGGHDAYALPEVHFPNHYYRIHPNDHLNFELNRILTFVGDDNLKEIQQVAAKINNLSDWKTEFLKTAQTALAEHRLFQAAFYYRFAEFFMAPGDPDKKTAYEQFLKLINQAYTDFPIEKHYIPYEGSYLKAVQVPVSNAKGVIVLFGGFDSYIEEFYPVASLYMKSGYHVIAFEGPGQGESLHKFGHVMTHEWEKPTRVILDYFNVTDVTLIGISLGGYLAVRAAAFEPRIKRVVAMDVMYDFFGCFTTRAGAVKGPLMKPALELKLEKLVNAVVRYQMENDMMAEWGINHGMMVMGADTPYDFLQKVRQYQTQDISHRVTQDFLLLAGSEDHMVPLEQFYKQKKALSHAASFEGRIFSSEEQAQNHCQIGNIKLALDYILEWLDAHHQKQ